MVKQELDELLPLGYIEKLLNTPTEIQKHYRKKKHNKIYWEDEKRDEKMQADWRRTILNTILKNPNEVEETLTRFIDMLKQ